VDPKAQTPFGFSIWPLKRQNDRRDAFEVWPGFCAAGFYFRGFNGFKINCLNILIL
jgi:hypothetical protein